jgi:hypothetical protein
VSYRLHPHARWLASPPWVLEQRLLLHLRRDRSSVRSRVAPSWAAQAEAGPTSRGLRALCTRAKPALWAWATRHCANGPSAVSAQWQSN